MVRQRIDRYDDADRLTSETWRAADGSTMYAFAWDYDAAGNRSWQRRGSVESYYDYDAANALTRVHEVPADAWTYFAYDPRGNCEHIQSPTGTTYFAYNAANLVATVRYEDGTPNTFHYDALLRRCAIEDSGGLSYLSWDAGGLDLLAERDAAGTVTAEYVNGHTPIPGIGTCVAVRLIVSGITYYRYLVYNHRGDLVRVLDESGNTIGSYEYNAWGVLLRSETSGPETRFGYQSNWLTLRDSNGKLLSSKARLYHAEYGVFLQRDPESDLPHAYHYANGNPTVQVDPDGLWVIRRQRQSRADAIAENKVLGGDMIRTLAIWAGLDLADFRHWLKLKGSTIKTRDGKVRLERLQPGSIICPGERVTVPNTAYVDASTYTFGGLGWRLLTRTDRIMNRWKAEKLKVVYTSIRKTTKPLMLTHLASQDLYKYMYVGHGAAGCLTAISDPGGTGTDKGIIAPARYTAYGINRLYLLACNTVNAAGEWRTNVARAGIVSLVRGTSTTFSVDVVHFTGLGSGRG
jgi:RHS repeat-associated protein